MSILKLIIAPDKRLSIKAKSVRLDDPINDIKSMRSTFDEMFRLMYDSKGIGLAAPQVGILQRFFVMHISNDTNPMVFINPKIRSISDELNEFNEGCLSFPEKYVNITRPSIIEVQYFDYHGIKKIDKFDGLHATCIQHENDHLNGVTIEDHLSIE